MRGGGNGVASLYAVVAATVATVAARWLVQ